MPMEREQFTFYASFFKAVGRIKKKADRCDAYDAICTYALTGTLPDIDSLPESVAIAFDLIRPVLDTAARKSKGGKSVPSAKEDIDKTSARHVEDEGKTAARYKEDSGKEKEKEKEVEKEIEEEKEKENECSLSHTPSQTKKEVAHARGDYGWVKLTDSQYEKLLADLGEAELKRCIDYVDESAQSTGNKNKWKDWNLTIRKCHRDGWGLSTAKPIKPVQIYGSANHDYDFSKLDDILNQI